ncbi:hypothetical protein XarbCFBP8147_03335 [Xanthomonas arboricola]|nr:hypothetical protein XarbCFBP8147_03335 [Xanthomonas arboricola]
MPHLLLHSAPSKPAQSIGTGLAIMQSISGRRRTEMSSRLACCCIVTAGVAACASMLGDLARTLRTRDQTL